MNSRMARATTVVAVVLAGMVVPVAPSGAVTSRSVTVDVRPGSTVDPQVNVGGGGQLPVAVISADGFDARTIVPGSVCFGDAENAEQRDCTEAHNAVHPEDVDGDGDLDALFHFDTAEAGFDAGDNRACLEGTTTDGIRIHGCDRISTRNGIPERSLPDLSPTLAVEPTVVDGHGAVEWTATVLNDGIGAITVHPGTTLLRFEAPANLVAPAISDAGGYACTATGAVFDCAPTAPDTISVGAARAFKLAGTATATPGPVTVEADADPAGAIAETDETDNAVAASSVVRASNLTTAMSVSPGAVSPGEPATWTAVVRNVGPGSTRFAAGTPLLRFTVPAGLSGVVASGPAGYACTAAFDCAPTAETTLAGGAEVVFHLTGNAPANPGDVEVTATADPTNAAAEGNEADNASSASLVVALPNLITALAVSPEEAGPGEATTWTATVTNTGPGGVHVPAAAALLRLSYSPDLPDAVVTPPAGYACSTTAPQTVDCAPTSSDTLPAGADRVFTLAARAPDVAGSVDVTATADPAGAVAERDETDNAATRTLGVVFRAGDLTATITGTPDPVDARRSVQWLSTVANSSPVSITIPAGTRVVRYEHPADFANLAMASPAGFTCYISAPQVVDCETTAIRVLAAGESLAFTFFATAPREPGLRSVTITADPLDTVVESNEANNAATATVTVQPPDFSIAMTATPDPVDARFSVQWNAVITNDGPAVAVLSTGTTVIRFVVPADLVNLAVSTPAAYTCFISAPQTVDCNTTSTTTLAVGGTIPITLFGTAPRTPGSISVTATADPLNAVPEADEADNAVTTAVTVQPPDFSMAMTASPDPADARTSAHWDAVITNDGPARARVSTGTTMIRFTIPTGLVNLAVSTPAGYTCFLADSTTVDCNTTATQTIEVGATVPVTLFATMPAAPGEVAVTATADPLGAVPEADEADNAVTTAVTVQPPDFSVAMTTSAPTVATGDSASWTATVANDGPAVARITSGTTVIRFVVPAGLSNLAVSTPAGYTCFISAPQTVDCNTTSTTTLAVGATVEVTLFGTAPTTPGDLTVTATADPLNAVPEADETDNSATASITAV